MRQWNAYLSIVNAGLVDTGLVDTGLQERVDEEISKIIISSTLYFCIKQIKINRVES